MCSAYLALQTDSTDHPRPLLGAMSSSELHDSALMLRAGATDRKCSPEVNSELLRPDIISGINQGPRVEVWTAGRFTDCHLVFQHLSIHGFHFELEIDKGSRRVWVTNVSLTRKRSVAWYSIRPQQTIDKTKTIPTHVCYTQTKAEAENAGDLKLMQIRDFQATQKKNSVENQARTRAS
ncbi:hypothetical protein EJ110_NYTH55277 [Nymphaea thermarum]|nr:hypothetical protein EJ110_NYTH55277 [Nymphaea thermarum]